MRARTGPIVAVALALLLMLPALLRPAPAAALSCGPCPATATADLNLRAGPSLADAVFRVIPAGAELAWDTFTGRVNGYVKVSFDGTDGWSHADYLLLWPGAATVTADLNLRADASLGAAVRTVMPAGTRVMVLGGPRNGFLSVRWEERQAVGWASADYLDVDDNDPAPPPVPGPGAGTATVTVGLNLRTGPGLGYPVALVMPAGARVTVGDAAGDGFVSVLYNGIAGWAFRDYLDFDDAGGGFAVGAGVLVAADGLNVRSAPGLLGGIVNVLPRGWLAFVASGPTAMDGYTWYRIEYMGQSGWVAGEFLTLA